MDHDDPKTIRWDSDEERARMQANLERLAQTEPFEPAGQAAAPVSPAEPVERAGSPLERVFPPPDGPAAAKRSRTADEDREEEEELLAPEEEKRLESVDKIGILGGKTAGKSYLFQGLVERTAAGSKAGALTYFIQDHATRLFSANERGGVAKTETPAQFLANFHAWNRLGRTMGINQTWYLLNLTLREGWLGRGCSSLDVEFFDGSGEGFFTAVRDPDTRPLWRNAFLDAKVVVFCLPIWAAFPGSSMQASDWTWRLALLQEFHKVVENYKDLRAENRRSQPVRSILALTMADDRRSALSTIRDRWILPYLDDPTRRLAALQTERGLASYLAQARRLSEALHGEFQASKDNQVARIPGALDFGAGRPWLIALSAIEGAALEKYEASPADSVAMARRLPPVPVHVELPLLVALCERFNALM
jgi:hypothetical protein